MVFYGRILFTLLIHSVTCVIRLEDPVNRSKKFNDFSALMSTTTGYSMKNKNIKTEGCTPVKVWILVRHGTKYPSEDTLNGIANLAKEIQPILKKLYGNKKSDKYKKLSKQWKKYMTDLINWKNFMNGGSHKNLSKHGEKDMINFGKRMQTSLNTLITNIKFNEIEVISSKETRCINSANIFVKELFLNRKYKIPIKRNTRRDKRLELDTIEKDKVTIQDPKNSKKLINPVEYFFQKNCPVITDKIQKKLFPGFVKNNSNYRKLITNEVVKSMYYACAYSFLFDTPEENGIRAWCKVFTLEDILTFEDMKDVEYYYRNGYHLEANSKLGNPLAKDILQFLKKPKAKKFKLFVGHTSNCFSLITRFNLFKDKKKITVDNIHEMRNRKWKSSFMTPVACNIIVKVFNCDAKSYMVTLYLNEIPIKMVNGKKKCERCPVELVIKYFQQLNLDDVGTSSSKNYKNKK